ncbi:MAG: sigma-54-dependent Fis family transcriptional regulator, partial [Myxococcales bacterium]|nr:sigma-54-dependent Fis family transcriptional regulator [Myxococcales bacterium]
MTTHSLASPVASAPDRLRVAVVAIEGRPGDLAARVIADLGHAVTRLATWAALSGLDFAPDVVLAPEPAIIASGGPDLGPDSRLVAVAGDEGWASVPEAARIDDVLPPLTHADEARRVLRRCLRTIVLERENRELRNRIEGRSRLDELDWSENDEVWRVARAAAGLDLPVLLRGEAGVGKVSLARAIHHGSQRAAGPCRVLPCGDDAPDRVEERLFGRGAWGGEIAGARGGTLVLREVDRLGAAAQARMLRLLDQGVYEPAGACRSLRGDVRVIATVRRSAETSSPAGDLRLDLYYRLAAIVLRVPSLRERRGALPALIGRLVADQCREMGRAPIRIAPEALDRLLGQSWNANLFELRSVIERAVLRARGGRI